MAKMCEAINCLNESVEDVKSEDSKSTFSFCEWHAYEFKYSTSWIGQDESEKVKYTIPKIKPTDRPNPYY